MEGGNAMQLAQQAQKEGIPDLRESGLKKVIDGLTSLDEINSIKDSVKLMKRHDTKFVFSNMTW